MNVNKIHIKALKLNENNYHYDLVLHYQVCESRQVLYRQPVLSIYTALYSYTVLYIHTCSDSIQVNRVGTIVARRDQDSQLIKLARYVLGNMKWICYSKMFLKNGNILHTSAF